MTITPEFMMGLAVAMPAIAGPLRLSDPASGSPASR